MTNLHGTPEPEAAANVGASTLSAGLSDVEPHAVRWGLYKIMGGMDIQYTKWHWTTDADMTVCGRPIKLISEKCETVLPETYDEVEKVDCKHCLRKLGR